MREICEFDVHVIVKNGTGSKTKYKRKKKKPHVFKFRRSVFLPQTINRQAQHYPGQWTPYIIFRSSGRDCGRRRLRRIIIIYNVGACTEARKRTNETTDVFDGVRRRAPLRKQVRIDRVRHHAMPMMNKNIVTWRRRLPNISGHNTHNGGQ
eukprot:XP_016659840.1 PREDICTED: uncharacterized protein LOC107883735 [Acyrthosiphon pisum]